MSAILLFKLNHPADKIAKKTLTKNTILRGKKQRGKIRDARLQER
jgi:hypothetical protein